MSSTTALDEGFSGPQVCKIAGITYRQLDYWARTDLLRPSLADARGSGSKRRYSYGDLLEIKVIKRLLDAGISLKQARKAIECMRDAGADVGSSNLVLQGSESILVRSGEEIVDLLKGGQGVLNIVAMAGVVKEVDAAVVALAPGAQAAPAAPVAPPAVEAGG
jgi:DNA-binding transcriptional MerR regulator